MWQTGEDAFFERVAGEALVEVLDLGDLHVADGRIVDGGFRVDHVFRFTFAVHVQLKRHIVIIIIINIITIINV